MDEERKNATKAVTCQIDDLRLVAGNVVCFVSAWFKNTSGVTVVQVVTLLRDPVLRNRIYAATAVPKF